MFRKDLSFLIVLILCLPLACALPVNLSGEVGMTSEAVVNSPIHGILVTVAPDATATPTPFMPISQEVGVIAEENESGAVPVEMSQQPWGKYAGPTIWPPIEIPPPTGILPQPEDQVNVLLLGDDQRPGDVGYRTDSIMLLILKPEQGTASLISFPRDLYVYVPGWTMQRINVVFARGGFELMAETFEYNFGVRPEYYVKINLWTLGSLVDSLGGIDVEVAMPLTDVGGSVPAGLVHMDGQLVEWYSRARYSTSDVDRTRRHQEILKALFLKLISLDALSRVPDLYRTYQQNVDTNLTLEAVSRWLPLATQLRDTSRVHQYRITYAEVTNWTVPSSGAMVLLPHREAILAIIQQAIQ